MSELADSHPLGAARRRGPTRWTKRLRRLGLAWQNALELARAGRLTAPYGAPFEVVHEERVYRLRRYHGEVALGGAPIAAPLLLVPPLMVASEIYDISPEVSAIAQLTRLGVDVWLVDFGAPEREAGGMNRTLDDHVRAVSEAVERVHAATGQDVHLAGYSQGGMFCYQAAAFRRSANVASVIAIGSPVDLHRNVGIDEDLTERLIAGAREALAWPLARLEGLPGLFTSTGFKVFSVRKEVHQLVDFVRNLHDRQALEKREAKRLFLGGQGFVAWPGPAFRKFVDELVVGNRMSSGGFVIDGHTVTLADITSPILYFVGDRDQVVRPAAIRGVRRACPLVTTLYEVPLSAGHFGLVVGTTASTITWPTVAEWMRWRAGQGPVPGKARDRLAPAQDTDAERSGDPTTQLRGRRRAPTVAEDLTEGEVRFDDDDEAPSGLDVDLELAQEVLSKVARTMVDRLGDATSELGAYLEHLRYQMPRVARLRRLRDETSISLGRTLAERAARAPEGTFFLWRGRAFTYADANRRVDAVVRGLLACGARPGQRIGVFMASRPSHLSAVAAINRLGAVAVLLSPNTSPVMLPRVLELAGADLLLADPEHAARLRANTSCPVFVLGGVGPVGGGAGAPGDRALPPDVIDLEQLDPAQVTLPAWYRANPGRARDLAIVFVTSGRHEPPRATRITNRRWAFSALGTAAAATLTARDTVYCCLPLHHPSGQLVAVGSALISGARLALASTFEPPVFWDEVRRYGATVVYYAGELCRRLIDAPSVVGEKNNPVRLFAGSGMRPDVWRELVARFGPVGVLELYASTEANAVLVNTAGRKIAAVGRPLPGSPEVRVVAWSVAEHDFVRDAGGGLVTARLEEPGMLLARLDTARGGSDLAHIDPRRLVHDAFEPGDVWFVTGDLMWVDPDGDHWRFDRESAALWTSAGAVASTRIEDALYAAPCVALCIAIGLPAPGAPGEEQPACAIALNPGTSADLDSLSAAIAALPAHARPQRVRVVESLPISGGYRPLKGPVRELSFANDPDVLRWDEPSQRLVPTTSTSPR
ncbi:MAG: AMP-binding protein [Kofleriaceae bacterium]